MSELNPRKLYLGLLADFGFAGGLTYRGVNTENYALVQPDGLPVFTGFYDYRRQRQLGRNTNDIYAIKWVPEEGPRDGSCVAMHQYCHEGDCAKSIERWIYDKTTPPRRTESQWDRPAVVDATIRYLVDGAFILRAEAASMLRTEFNNESPRNALDYAYELAQSNNQNVGKLTSETLDRYASQDPFDIFLDEH